MFMATMLNKSQPYSSREQAEKHLAQFIVGNIKGHIFRNPGQEVLNFFYQENYNEFLMAWNHWVDKDWIFLGSATWKALIEECKVDQTFF